MTDPLPAIATDDLDEIAAEGMPQVWERLRGASIFITGGTGFVGKWLVASLLHADVVHRLGLRLSVLTRRPQQLVRSCPYWAGDGRLRLVRGDLQDFEFPGEPFTHVVHAALPVAPSPATSAAEGGGALSRLAEQGARRACEFAAAAGAHRFLHISSGAVYGTGQAAADFMEDRAPAALAPGEAAPNEYTRAKRLAEAVVLDSRWPFAVSVARCFAFVGPYLMPEGGTAAAQFVERAQAGLPIIVRGSGMDRRSYQYAGDMARWLITLLVLGGPGRAYNVGSDEDISITELARAIASVASNQLQVIVEGRSAPGLAGSFYVPTLARARDELGLHNRVSLSDGLRRMLAWRARATSAMET